MDNEYYGYYDYYYDYEKPSDVYNSLQHSSQHCNKQVYGELETKSTEKFQADIESNVNYYYDYYIYKNQKNEKNVSQYSYNNPIYDDVPLSKIKNSKEKKQNKKFNSKKAICRNELSKTIQNIEMKLNASRKTIDKIKQTQANFQKQQALMRFKGAAFAVQALSKLKGTSQNATDTKQDKTTQATFYCKCNTTLMSPDTFEWPAVPSQFDISNTLVSNAKKKLAVSFKDNNTKTTLPEKWPELPELEDEEWPQPPNENLPQSPVAWSESKSDKWSEPPDIKQQPPTEKWPKTPDIKWPDPSTNKWPKTPDNKWPEPPVDKWPQPPTEKWPKPPDNKWPEPPVEKWPEPPDAKWPESATARWAKSPNANQPELQEDNWPELPTDILMSQDEDPVYWPKPPGNLEQIPRKNLVTNSQGKKKSQLNRTTPAKNEKIHQAQTHFSIRNTNTGSQIKNKKTKTIKHSQNGKQIQRKETKESRAPTAENKKATSILFSKLLYPEEKQILKTRMGTHVQIFSMAVGHVWSLIRGEWKKILSAVICYVKDFEKKHHLLRVLDMEDFLIWKDITIDSIVEYEINNDVFHTFQTKENEYRYGLFFIDIEEGKQLQQSITAKLLQIKERKLEKLEQKRRQVGPVTFAITFINRINAQKKNKSQNNQPRLPTPLPAINMEELMNTKEASINIGLSDKTSDIDKKKLPLMSPQHKKLMASIREGKTLKKTEVSMRQRITELKLSNNIESALKNAVCNMNNNRGTSFEQLIHNRRVLISNSDVESDVSETGWSDDD